MLCVSTSLLNPQFPGIGSNKRVDSGLFFFVEQTNIQEQKSRLYEKNCVIQHGYGIHLHCEAAW